MRTQQTFKAYLITVVFVHVLLSTPSDISFFMWSVFPEWWAQVRKNSKPLESERALISSRRFV